MIRCLGSVAEELLSTELWQLETDFSPSRNGQIQFSSEFMAKLPLQEKARFRLIQLFQLAFGFVGRRAAACVIRQNRRKMFERIRAPGFGELHLLFTLHTTNA